MNENIPKRGEPGAVVAPVPEQFDDLAWFAFENADDLCNPDVGCCDYHRFWSVLRLLDLEGRPPRGGAFLMEQFCELGSAEGEIRVLLAGSADTGVPCVIMNSARAADLAPQLTVIDRCRTPLTQIERFAESCGLAIETLQGALWDCTESGFDAIVSHNVMGFNTDAERRKVYHMAAQSLRPGGRFLQIETLRDSFVSRNHEHADELTAAFLARSGAKHLPAATMARLEPAARAFWSRSNLRNAYTETALREHLQAAALGLLTLDYRSDASPTSPMDLMRREAPKQRAFIVSERPA